MDEPGKVIQAAMIMPWSSEADSEAYLRDLMLHGEAWTRTNSDGTRSHVPLSSVFFRPT